MDRWIGGMVKSDQVDIWIVEQVDWWTVYIHRNNICNMARPFPSAAIQCQFHMQDDNTIPICSNTVAVPYATRQYHFHLQHANAIFVGNTAMSFPHAIWQCHFLNAVWKWNFHMQHISPYSHMPLYRGAYKLQYLEIMDNIWNLFVSLLGFYMDIPAFCLM